MVNCFASKETNLFYLNMLNTQFIDLIIKSTQAQSVFEIETIQSLWSGYGQIIRLGLTGTERKTVVLKQIDLNTSGGHPRGWNTDISHQRKLKSYQVECNWYQNWSQYCDPQCRVPEILAMQKNTEQMVLIMEDIDAAGYSVRKQYANFNDMQSCLEWLAHFHATFMQQVPEGLWPVGTYWHLDTRPDELDALDDMPLKQAAADIDRTLNNCHYQTFVHGDAKLANFCFADQGNAVAAVDFQYVGGGCGMKDVAYFIGSCLHEEDCQKYEQQLLDHYFKTLQKALESRNNSIAFEQLKQEWRKLYPYAWTDFHRFLKGWSPGHWKIHSYSERLAREVVSSLSTETEK